jgi:hypothetical protein
MTIEKLGVNLELISGPPYRTILRRRARTLGSM